VVSGMRQAKRPVSALLAGPYGHPYHPMLVTIPIGSWIASLGFDVASQLVSKPGFLAEGSQWLIGIGVLGAVAAGMVGLLDLAAIPAGTAAFRTACTHMCLNLLVTFGYGADFAWRFHAHSYRAPVNPLLIAISAACVATLCVSGYLGGKLTYRYGVRVVSERIQADGYLAAGATRRRSAGGLDPTETRGSGSVIGLRGAWCPPRRPARGTSRRSAAHAAACRSGARAQAAVPPLWPGTCRPIASA
jgi:uncharacterized membrane protein